MVKLHMHTWLSSFILLRSFSYFRLLYRRYFSEEQMWYASYVPDLTQQNWVTLLSPICAWLYLIRTTILESMLRCLSVFWCTSVVSWYHLYAVLLLRLLHLKVYFGKSWHLWRISFDRQWWLAIFAIWLLIVIQK